MPFPGVPFPRVLVHSVRVPQKYYKQRFRMKTFKVYTDEFNIGVPTKYILEIYQRKSFTETYQAVDANGQPVNLPPYAIAMQIKRDVNSDVPLVELSPGNGIEIDGDELTVKLTSE